MLPKFEARMEKRQLSTKMVFETVLESSYPNPDRKTVNSPQENRLCSLLLT